ncbi:hypothetical protein [Dyella caseinilytica]|uniref:Twin-arginine translocation signal domain-containing protein n=1 Tax=Dyella caseinilytica TaxID=1849581 RepID=A0ABX7H0T0_9GAMM|nr:hypothetical protein [Dyella caseinilytica]QRN55674.1 hypothetical protein ISN74_10310 [Dyella caseinilytica]
MPMSRRDFPGHAIKATGAAAVIGLPPRTSDFSALVAKRPYRVKAWMQNNVGQRDSRTLPDHA